MPRNRQPARSQRGASVAAVAVVVLVGLGIVYVATRHTPPGPPPTYCAARAGDQTMQLTVDQARITATIAGVAAERGLPTRAVTIAIATAMQESKLSDPHYGDRDSVGVFQQRPSQGWGTDRQIENPVYAAGKFFAALQAVPDYQHIAVYKAVQAVQRSADGAAYQQYATMAAQLARAFTGALPRAVWCSYTKTPAGARLQSARQSLASTFGPLPVQAAGDPTMSVQPRSVRQGWAVASWLITHASSFGIDDVRYQGFQWLATSSTGRWVKQPHGKGSTQPAPALVVFG